MTNDLSWLCSIARVIEVRDFAVDEAVFAGDHPVGRDYEHNDNASVTADERNMPAVVPLVWVVNGAVVVSSLSSGSIVERAESIRNCGVCGPLQSAANFVTKSPPSHNITATNQGARCVLLTQTAFDSMATLDPVAGRIVRHYLHLHLFDH